MTLRAIVYHGLSDSNIPRAYYDRIFIDPVQFRAQVVELSRNWHVVSMADIEAHIAEKLPLPDRSVHISFDDGHSSSLAAAEILDQYRLPWTLFPVVDAVLDGYEPWFVRLARSVADTSTCVVAGASHRMESDREKWNFHRWAKAKIMAADAAIEQHLLDEILRRNCLRTPGERRWPFLDAAGLVQLSRAGVEIGNHSATHCNLNRCNSEDLYREVEVSRLRLSAVIGREVRYFSYPDGRTHRRVTRSVRASHNLGAAMWTTGAALSRYALRRFDAGPSPDSLATVLSRGYPARFAVRRLGWTCRPAVAEVAYRLGNRRAPTFSLRWPSPI